MTMTALLIAHVLEIILLVNLCIRTYRIVKKLEGSDE